MLSNGVADRTYVAVEKMRTHVLNRNTGSAINTFCFCLVGCD